jgi:hypothetical protein
LGRTLYGSRLSANGDVIPATCCLLTGVVVVQIPVLEPAAVPTASSAAARSSAAAAVAAKCPSASRSSLASSIACDGHGVS